MNFACAADTVELVGKPPFANVQVIDFQHGRLAFRGVSGEVLRKGAWAIATLNIDLNAALNEAEQAASAGNWPVAIAKYQTALANQPLGWQRDLLRFRRMQAFSRAGQPQRALETLFELAREDSSMPAEAVPRALAASGSDANRAALALLREPRIRTLGSALQAPLAELRLELTLLEEPERARRDFAPIAETRPQNDELRPAAQADEDDDSAPLLFGTPQSKPLEKTSLLPTSGIWDEFARLIEAGDSGAAAQLAARCTPFVGEAARPTFRFWRARTQLLQNEVDIAAEGFLDVATSASDRALSSEATYHGALARERQNRASAALALLVELSNRDDLSADLRRRVDAAMKRMSE